MKTLLFLICLLVAPLAHAQEPIRVHVFTKTSAFVDDESKKRQATVDGVIKALGKSKIVQPADSADVEVEIVASVVVEEKDSLSAMNNALNGAHNSETKKVTYRVATLRRGDYTTELKGKNENMLARAIEKWAKENSPRLTK